MHGGDRLGWLQLSRQRLSQQKLLRSRRRSNDPNECGAVVRFAPPLVTDACSAVTNVSCDPPSGSFFPVGTTLVQCSASDSAGNTATCRFLVRIDYVQA